MISRPTFVGFPQSMLVRATVPGNGTELWQWWHTVERLNKGLETIEVITSQGFQQVPTTDGELYFSYLAGQCCEVVYIGQLNDNTADVSRDTCKSGHRSASLIAA